ncbi:hypothetical protein C7446_2574 [Kushneria sinocarnis]|uniref:Uncharacterized protein n=1 Tax=Kushneria sinocarnis TaxID=595502 RepID=A0A420WUP9_9GAMM|nr:hypothetical protein [Kushneria sinocarnis]RKQ97154.1 hypothetical protein C7446_2574 [Kushneria sinocarnis]
MLILDGNTIDQLNLGSQKIGRAYLGDQLVYAALEQLLFLNGQSGLLYRVEPQYLYQDEAGTTPVTGSGDPVALIRDAGPNGLDGIVRGGTATYQVDSNGAGFLELSGQSIEAGSGTDLQLGRPQFCIGMETSDSIGGGSHWAIFRARSGGFDDAALSIYESSDDYVSLSYSSLLSSDDQLNGVPARRVMGADPDSNVIWTTGFDDRTGAFSDGEIDYPASADSYPLIIGSRQNAYETWPGRFYGAIYGEEFGAALIQRYRQHLTSLMQLSSL